MWAGSGERVMASRTHFPPLTILRTVRREDDAPAEAPQGKVRLLRELGRRGGPRHHHGTVCHGVVSSPCGCCRYLCWCGACIQRGRQSLQPDLEVGNSRVGFPAPTVRCCCRAASRAKQQRLQPTPTPSLATQPLPLHLDVTSADALGGVRHPWQPAEGRSAEKARRVVVRGSQRSSLREVGGIGVRVGRSRSSDRSIDRLRLGMMGWRGG